MLNLPNDTTFNFDVRTRGWGERSLKTRGRWLVGYGNLSYA